MGIQPELPRGVVGNARQRVVAGVREQVLRARGPQGDDGAHGSVAEDRVVASVGELQLEDHGVIAETGERPTRGSRRAYTQETFKTMLLSEVCRGFTYTWRVTSCRPPWMTPANPQRK